MAQEDPFPLFIQPPNSDYNKEKSYVPPVYFEEGVRERLQNPTAASFFKKVTAVNQAGKIGLSYEGFSPDAYWDVNHWSIGYGTPASGENEHIDEPEARKRMESHYKTLHKTLLDRYDGYRAANPNVQGAILDAAYTLKDLRRYPLISNYLSKPETMPYAIQELPSFRKVQVTDPETKEKKWVIRKGLENRRADEFRLATTNEDQELFPIYRNR